jgi:transcriptional regulator with XRE-family HTH domain
MTFAQSLRRQRDRLKLTQDELADKLKLSRSSVEKWEQGIRTPKPITQSAILSELRKIKTKKLAALRQLSKPTRK